MADDGAEEKSGSGKAAATTGQKSTGNHPRPRSGFVDGLVKLPGLVPPRWKSADGKRLYEWD